MSLNLFKSSVSPNMMYPYKSNKLPSVSAQKSQAARQDMHPTINAPSTGIFLASMVIRTEFSPHNAKTRSSMKLTRIKGG